MSIYDALSALSLDRQELLNSPHATPIVNPAIYLKNLSDTVLWLQTRLDSGRPPKPPVDAAAIWATWRPLSSLQELYRRESSVHSAFRHSLRCATNLSLNCDVIPNIIDFQVVVSRDDEWKIRQAKKRLSKEVNASLDLWLRSNEVVVPSSIGLDLHEDDKGALSFIPTCPELDNQTFRTVFQRNPEVQSLYSADQAGIGRIRIVLPENQVRVLERMKRVHGATGTLKQKLKDDPLQVFDGIAGDVELPVSYGERVTGIGLLNEIEFAPIPKPPNDEPGLEMLWAGAHSDSSSDNVTADEQSENKVDRKTLLIETHDEEVRDMYTGYGNDSIQTWPYRHN